MQYFPRSRLINISGWGGDRRLLLRCMRWTADGLRGVSPQVSPRKERKQRLGAKLKPARRLTRKFTFLRFQLVPLRKPEMELENG